MTEDSRIVPIGNPDGWSWHNERKEMATGITPGELEKMLAVYREWRENAKIHVEGDIYRLPGVLSNPEGVWYELWRMEVWDSEFATAIVSLEEEPRPELVAAMFRELKETWHRPSE
jgi:hypothetical protein